MLITIGIPFFNAESTLTNAIRSVFAQTHTDWELLLVNDGSTDRSLEIARAVKDPRVRVISDGCNRKLAYRLNQIVREASYELVGRMDADDMMSPHRFARQLEVLQDPEVQIVSSAMCMLSSHHLPTGYRGRVGNTLNFQTLIRGREIAHPSLLGRASWFERNPYDVDAIRGEDIELWCRTFQNGQLTQRNLRILEEPLYFSGEDRGVTFEKVRCSHVVIRKLLRRYGPSTIGRRATLLELLRSHARTEILWICSLCGLLSQVTSKARCRRISDPELLARVHAEIAQVLSTRVPGLG